MAVTYELVLQGGGRRDNSSESCHDDTDFIVHLLVCLCCNLEGRLTKRGGFSITVQDSLHENRQQALEVSCILKTAFNNACGLLELVSIKSSEHFMVHTIAVCDNVFEIIISRSPSPALKRSTLGLRVSRSCLVSWMTFSSELKRAPSSASMSVVSFSMMLVTLWYR